MNNVVLRKRDERGAVCEVGGETLFFLPSAEARLNPEGWRFAEEMCREVDAELPFSLANNVRGSVLTAEEFLDGPSA